MLSGQSNKQCKNNECKIKDLLKAALGAEYLAYITIHGFDTLLQTLTPACSYHRAWDAVMAVPTTDACLRSTGVGLDPAQSQLLQHPGTETAVSSHSILLFSMLHLPASQTTNILSIFKISPI